MNGTSLDPPVTNGYAVITRTWQAGDKIDLEVPLKVQRVKGIDKIAGDQGACRFAVRPADLQPGKRGSEAGQCAAPDADLQAAVASRSAGRRDGHQGDLGRRLVRCWPFPTTPATTVTTGAIQGVGQG